MKSNAILFLYCVVIAALLGSYSWSATRNTISYSSAAYSTGTVSNVLEFAFSADINNDNYFLAGSYQDKRSTWSNNITSIGIGQILGNGSYGDISLGYGIASDGQRSDHINANYYRETADSISSIGYSLKAYPGYNAQGLNIGIKMRLFDRMKISGKYYLNVGSDNIVSHAISCNADYEIAPSLVLRSGISIGNRLLEGEYGKAADGAFRALVLGAEKEFKNDIKVSYLFEYLSKDNSYQTNKSSFMFAMKI